MRIKSVVALMCIGLWAADQVPGYHTAPIKFIGDRTYRGFV